MCHYYQLQPTEDLPLVAKAKFLKSKVDSLRTVSLNFMLKCITSREQEKHERMKRLKRLAEMEIALCEILGEATVIVPYYKGKELPSEEKLKEFLAIIQKMEERKVRLITTHTHAYTMCFAPIISGIKPSNLFCYERKDHVTVVCVRSRTLK